MPPVTISAIVDLSKVKMKWKETYVSEGLNRKVIPAMPKGIYSGLRLIQNISSPRQVEVSAAPDVTHAAVHQSATGYSTTYHDVAGVSTILDLSNAALNNQETVIALSITYVIGADTTASWIAYPIADWNALTDAQRAERIVLGTVSVPAPATNITTAMITPNRRTAAWESESPGSVPWSPIVKNPSFEHGGTGSSGSGQYLISDWRNRVDLEVNGRFELGVATVRSGAKSLAFNKTIVGASTGKIEQYQEVPVTPGQLVRVTGWIRQLIAPTGGSYTFNVYWGDLDSLASGSLTITASAAGLDAAFRKVESTFKVPAGKFVIKTVTIEVVGVTSASTGVAAVFDDFQVFIETGSPLTRQAALANSLRQQMVSALFFEDPSTYAANGQLSALLRYDKSTPVGEGSLIGQRKDLADNSAQPALSWMGRIIDLGKFMLFGSAESNQPRIEGPFSSNEPFTLMFETRREGPAGKGLRLYAGYLFGGSTEPGFFLTVNAKHDGTNWTRDVNGEGSSGVYIDADENRGNIVSSNGAPCLTTYVHRAADPNTWTTWQEAVSLMGLNDPEGGSALQTSQILIPRYFDQTKPVIVISGAPEPRGPVLQGDGDSILVGGIDHAGIYFYPDSRVVHEDFDDSTLGYYLRQDIVNVGSTTLSPANSRATLVTNAASGSISVFRPNVAYQNWGSNGGLFRLGFRARIAIGGITNTEQYIGYWCPGQGNPDNNAALAMAFKIVNGVVSVIADGGAATASTGVTVGVGQIRWFTLVFDPTNGVVQWHITGSGGTIASGMVGGTYGTLAASAEAGDPNYPFIGVKTTTAATSSITADCLTAWMGDREGM